MPVSRVRQVCQMDDEYRLVSKEAVLLITKAAEMFLQDLAGTCGKMASYQKRKTLQVQDLIQVAEHSDKFHFLKDSKLPSLNVNKPQAPIQVQTEDDLKDLENLDLEDLEMQE